MHTQGRAELLKFTMPICMTRIVASIPSERRNTLYRLYHVSSDIDDEARAVRCMRGRRMPRLKAARAAQPYCRLGHNQTSLNPPHMHAIRIVLQSRHACIMGAGCSAMVFKCSSMLTGYGMQGVQTKLLPKGCTYTVSGIYRNECRRIIRAGHDVWKE